MIICTSIASVKSDAQDNNNSLGLPKLSDFLLRGEPLQSPEQGSVNLGNRSLLQDRNVEDLDENNDDEVVNETNDDEIDEEKVLEPGPVLPKLPELPVAGFGDGNDVTTKIPQEEQGQYENNGK